MKLYNVAEGRCVKTLDLDLPQNVSSVALSSDGALLASAMVQLLELRNAATGVLIKNINLDPWMVTATSFSPDGKLVAAGLQNGQVRVWDSGLSESIAKFNAASHSISALNWSPDGKILLWDRAGLGAARRPLLGYALKRR